MTPYPNPNTDAEQAFNISLVQTRSSIEQTNGIVKNRFPCLRHLRMQPGEAITVTVAAVVLHNIAIQLGDRVDIPAAPNAPDMNGGIEDNAAGRVVRDRIVREFFTE